MRIHGNQVVIRYANFNETQKFLVAFGNENLFVNGVAKGTFLGRSAYLKISAQPPATIFVTPIDIEKLIKTEGLILVKLTMVAIQDSRGCCTFQMSLVYNRVC